jgi:hypothetical protein
MPAGTRGEVGGPGPVSRRSVAEALVTVTITLTAKGKGAPEGTVLRQALFGWAFNPATREQVRCARLPPPWDGWPAPRYRSARWMSRRRCDWRWARAPGPWRGRRRPGRPSGASGRCSTTPWLRGRAGRRRHPCDGSNPISYAKVPTVDRYEISAAIGFLVLAAGDVVDPDSAQAPGNQTGGTAVACLLLVAAHVVLLSWPELPPTELHCVSRTQKGACL